MRTPGPAAAPNPAGPRHLDVQRVALAQPVDGHAQDRAVGRATLDAMRPPLGSDHVVELEGTDVTHVLGHQLAVALVQFPNARGQLTVAGRTLVRDASADAIARAVLDALNRTIAEATER